MWVTERPGAEITRLRSRHRLFDQNRSDRSRLAGSLIFLALVLFGGVVWWIAGRWPVGLAWTLFAAAAAVLEVWSHRVSRDESGSEDSWVSRGEPSVVQVVVVVSMFAVMLITVCVGFGWGWGDAVPVLGAVGVMQLGMSWWSGRSRRRKKLSGSDDPLGG